MMRPCEPGDAFRPSRKPDKAPNTPPAWTAIARFLNAAEAGYFAYELKLSRNIPVKLGAEEELEPVSGHCSTSFVLSVPQVWAEKAAKTLQELVRETDSEDYIPERVSSALEYERLPVSRSRPFEPFYDEDNFVEPASIHWVPIVVTLAAGSLAIWGIKTLWEPARPQAAPINAPRNVLWEGMKTTHGRKSMQQVPISRSASGEEASRPGGF
jgi:hypothetical protein